MNSACSKNTVVRIALGITIVAGFSIAGLNLLGVKQRLLNLQSELRTQKAARQTAEAGWTAANTELRGTTTALAKTTTALESAIAEKERIAADASHQHERADRLQSELTQSRQDFGQTRAELSRYEATEMKPEQILVAARELKNIRAELRIANARNEALASAVKTLEARLEPEQEVVPLPAGLRGKIVVSDPKWRFVVLDAGENQGMLKRGEMLISRAGKLVAKVRVSRVEKDRCIANLLPGWEFTDLLEGDVALPAPPRS